MSKNRAARTLAQKVACQYVLTAFGELEHLCFSKLNAQGSKLGRFDGRVQVEPNFEIGIQVLWRKDGGLQEA